jgi:hypothetical protein
MQVLNCQLGQNDSLRMTAPDTSALKFVNLGQQRVYDLNIVLAGRASHGRFTHTAISIPAHSTHYILPNWHDLPHQPVRIFEDVGNIGSIHDTITLTNQLTGVGGQLDLEIPLEFRLEQNYPNPFNPSTTIRYGLPVRSRVTLTVFNTLGQQVALLQDGEQEAGYHEVKFDGSHLSSGMYFYRMHTGSFTEVRKLLIVR